MRAWGRLRAPRAHRFNSRRRPGAEGGPSPPKCPWGKEKMGGPDQASRLRAFPRVVAEPCSGAMGGGRNAMRSRSVFVTGGERECPGCVMDVGEPEGLPFCASGVR